MRYALSRFIFFSVRSRLGVILVVVHLALAIYAFSMTPPAPDSFSEPDAGCHGIPAAGRWIHLCDETRLMKVLSTVDIVALFIYVTVTMLLTVVALAVLQITGWDMPSLNMYVFSWFVAVGLLLITSFQWLLVGSCVEAIARSVRKRSVRQTT